MAAIGYICSIQSIFVYMLPKSTKRLIKFHPDIFQIGRVINIGQQYFFI